MYLKRPQKKKRDYVLIRHKPSFGFPYHEKERENLNDKTIARRRETFCRFDLISLLSLALDLAEREHFFFMTKNMSMDRMKKKHAWVRF